MPKPSGNELAALDAVITELASKGLAKYLEDADLVSEAIAWLHEETEIPKAVLRLALRLLATLVAGAARKGGGRLAKIGRQRIKKMLVKLPYYDRFAKIIGRLGAHLDEKVAAKQEMKEILAGRRPPHNPEFANRLTLELQAQVKEMQVLDDLGQKLEKFESLLRPQPPLRLTLLELSNETRFVYSAQKTPFLGRDAEIEALEAFLQSDPSFGWWLVTGPGGLGKSRLALELCLRHGMSWRAGFLPTETNVADWDRWQPDQPTLLLADYASTRPEKLRDIALALKARNDLEVPVRLLLLEREAEGPWYSSFEGTGTDRHVIAAARHREPLVLEPLDDDALWQIVASIVEAAGRTVPDKDSTLKTLRDLDPSGRPLYAAFLADALAGGRDPRKWDRTALVKDVLDREADKHWRPAGVTEQDKNLLALATLCGGMKVTDLTTTEASGLLPKVDEFSPDRYRVLSGRDAKESFAPLEPDILGELFVLEHLKPAHAADKTRAETMRRAGWAASPKGMFSFLSRAGMDFPTHPVLRLLDRPAVENEAHRLAWSTAAVNLINVYGTAGDLAAAQEVYDALAALAAAHEDKPILRDLHAKSAVNLIAAYGTAGDLTTAQGLYNTLTTLAAGYPDEHALRQEQAKGAMNLITDHGRVGDLKTAQRLYDALAALAAAHEDEPALREEQGNCAVNLIAYYGGAGDLTAAQGIYDDLSTLADTHKEEPNLLELQAMGAFNLDHVYWQSGDDGAATRLLRSIEESPELLNAFRAFQALVEERRRGNNDPEPSQK